MWLYMKQSKLLENIGIKHRLKILNACPNKNVFRADSQRLKLFRMDVLQKKVPGDRTSIMLTLVFNSVLTPGTC